MAAPTFDQDVYYRIYLRSPSGYLYRYSNGSVLMGAENYEPSDSTSLWHVRPKAPYYYISQKPDSGSDWWNMGVYYDPTDDSGGKTRLSLQKPDDSNPAQLWFIQAWPDSDHYYLNNAANGSQINLDVRYDRIRPFMALHPDSSFGNEHWVFFAAAAIPPSTTSSSISSTATDPPISSSPGNSTNSPTTSSSSGLSTGAKAGIGIAAALVGIIAAVILTSLFWRRRQQRSQGPTESVETGSKAVLEVSQGTSPDGTFYGSHDRALPVYQDSRPVHELGSGSGSRNELP
ncbi:hypothetical protein F5884DRAFT_860792 [Xylogone sp. PMI_703]|nr:hypothetical protein F5884DRAFT_860792 [Xylogone sp. PMI_703]